MSYEIYSEIAINEAINWQQAGEFVKSNALKGAVGDYSKLLSKDPNVRKDASILGTAAKTASMYRNFNAGVDQAYRERKEQLEARRSLEAKKKADQAVQKLEAEQKRTEQIQSQNENSIFDKRTTEQVLEDWDEDEKKRMGRREITAEALKAAAISGTAYSRAKAREEIKARSQKKIQNEAFIDTVRSGAADIGTTLAASAISTGASTLANAALNKGGYYLTKAQFALADKKAERQREKEANAKAQQLKLQNKQMKEQQALEAKQKADLAKP